MDKKGQKPEIDPLDPVMTKKLNEQAMAKTLTAFDKIAKKALSKVMQHSNPFLVEQSNHNNNQNMLNEQNHFGTPVNDTMLQPTYTQPASNNFAVFAMPNEYGKTRYDIANQATGQKLTGNIALAECANGIVKLLNKGYSFYSPQIKSLLEFEQNYQKYYNDALVFKKKISNNPHRDMIIETRFEESKAKAQETKRRLVEFANKL